MKKLIETVTGTFFEVYLHYSVVKVGFGNWNIICEVSFNLSMKKFKCHTTNSEMIDTITEMKSEGARYEDVQYFMHHSVYDEIKYEISEWLYLEFE